MEPSLPAARSDQPLTKTAFVLALSRDIPAAEVVQKAKAAGFDMTTHRVHEIRSAAKRAAKKTSGPKLTKPLAPAKAAMGAKTAFILAQPSTMGPSEVVRLAKAAGLEFSRQYVSKTRWAARQAGVPAKAAQAAKAAAPAKAKAARKPAIAKKASRATPKTWAAPAVSRSDEVAFRKLVLDLGLGRAKALMADVEKKLQDLLAGK
jgi:hypothetical protein